MLRHGPHNLYGIIADAAGIVGTGNNPPYTVEDFLSFYPQFGENPNTGAYNVPIEVINAYIAVANSLVSANRFKNMWKIAIGLLVAHFLTLYLQAASSPDGTAPSIVESGLAKGLVSNKTAGSLSVGYDFATLNSDKAFDGWGTFRQTAFGQQFITLAKLAGTAVMYVR